jgi:hypothetical protein
MCHGKRRSIRVVGSGGFRNELVNVGDVSQGDERRIKRKNDRTWCPVVFGGQRPRDTMWLTSNAPGSAVGLFGPVYRSGESGNNLAADFTAGMSAGVDVDIGQSIGDGA